MKTVSFAFLLLFVFASTAFANFEFEDCFVFSSVGTWKNFVYTGLLKVHSVKSRHTGGDTARMLTTPDVAFVEGVDFEIDYKISRMRLISNALTKKFAFRGGHPENGDMPRVYVKATFSGSPYAPGAGNASSNNKKLPRWNNLLKTKSTLNILLLGDSTVHAQVENEQCTWYNRWAAEIKARYPRVTTINFGRADIGGTTSSILFNNTYYWDDGRGEPLNFLDESLGFLSLPAGTPPDLVVVAYINDGSTPEGPEYYYENISTLLSEFRKARKWPDLEFVLISGLPSRSFAHFAQLREKILQLEKVHAGVVAIDVTTAWNDLFSRKTEEDVLANNTNHQNCMSTVAYSYELQRILLPADDGKAD